MALDTWEERMAAAAAARRIADPPLFDPHAKHHTHRLGNFLWCSCGEPMGIITVAITGDEPPPTGRCPICGAPDDSAAWSA